MSIDRATHKFPTRYFVYILKIFRTRFWRAIRQTSVNVAIKIKGLYVNKFYKKKKIRKCGIFSQQQVAQFY